MLCLNLVTSVWKRPAVVSTIAIAKRVRMLKSVIEDYMQLSVELINVHRNALTVVLKVGRNPKS